MNSSITELTICPQSVLLTALSICLFFSVPCVIGFVRNKQVKKFFLWLAPVPSILWALTPKLCFHKAFENSFFHVLVLIALYMVGLFILRTHKSVIVKSLCCLVFVAPMLLVQWILWGFSIEVLVDTQMVR